MPAVVLYAHPYPHRSRAGRALLAGVRDLPFVSVRTLYSLYPDFAIDAAAEKAALLAADVIVWQSPFYWYGAPAMLHLWFEKVLEHGWAYGTGGDALRGKRVLWVATTGGPAASYAPGEMHGHRFEAFVPAFQQTAAFCGMHWEPPLIVHGAQQIDELELAHATTLYRERLVSLEEQTHG
ncbi:MAG: glutathione-regulated potassium-efflux system oxidoreductase KefF [Polyangiales bacterium]